jgi:hypothetical protein
MQQQLPPNGSECPSYHGHKVCNVVPLYNEANRSQGYGLDLAGQIEPACNNGRPGAGRACYYDASCTHRA